MDGVWDNLPLDVVSAMQSAVTTPSSNSISVPIIHFGRINFDYQVGFIRGGFSRVYFGTHNQKRVAIKMLFVMELNKETVDKFYLEAKVLIELQHDCVVECYGITLLPPAFGVVMEYCQKGSLYTYLYGSSRRKPSKRAWSTSGHTSDLFSLSKNVSSRSSSRDALSSAPRSDRQSSADIELRVSTSSAAARRSPEMKMMSCAASAVAFIHRKGYMHCDMKSLNYLVTDVSIDRFLDLVVIVLCCNRSWD